jgi:hypothetical protein
MEKALSATPIWARMLGATASLICMSFLLLRTSFLADSRSSVLQRRGLQAIEEGLPVKDLPIDITAAGEGPEQPPASHAETPNKMRALAVVVSSSLPGKRLCQTRPSYLCCELKKKKKKKNWHHRRHSQCSPSDSSEDTVAHGPWSLRTILA